MIVVVEGISASGKTRWCARHGLDRVIAENGPLKDVPHPLSDPTAAARFWAERNVDRWQAALAMERNASLALCDTDPLKLHYTWCRWQIGEASKTEWLMELEATRATVEAGRIGFADVYLVEAVEPEVARTRARADPSRRRRNLDLHVRLQPPLLRWYSALDAVLPGRVQLGLPLTLPAPIDHGPRYDVTSFDKLIESLPAR